MRSARHGCEMISIHVTMGCVKDPLIWGEETQTNGTRAVQARQQPHVPGTVETRQIGWQ